MLESHDILGSTLTTSALGGPIDTVTTVDNENELNEFLKSKVPFRILGAGSNVVISDEGIRGTILRLGKGFRTLKEVSSGRFLVGGSYSLMTLARELSKSGFSGLEFAGGIPAQVGGAVFMNAGAHGGEMKDIVRVVHGIHGDGRKESIDSKTMTWHYRTSGLPKDFVIYSAELELIKDDPEKISQKLSEHLAERKKRQPLSLPSCGSVFKNPSPETSAGSLIEKAGLKGHTIGGLMVSELHANWIVNPEKKGTTEQFEKLIQLITSTVESRFQVNLEPEVRIW